jgi:hypothetical protein
MNYFFPCHSGLCYIGKKYDGVLNEVSILVRCTTESILRREFLLSENDAFYDKCVQKGMPCVLAQVRIFQRYQHVEKIFCHLNLSAACLLDLLR